MNDREASRADEMADRVLGTYRDIFSGAERADPVETVAQRVGRTYRDIYPTTSGDERQEDSL